MDSRTLSFLFFTLPLILNSLSPMPANAEPNTTLIANVCNTSRDEAGCLALLRADPQCLTAENYLELSKFSLELAITKATEIQDFFKGLLKTNPAPSIRLCAFTIYDGVLINFRNALAELCESIESANYECFTVDDAARYCHYQLASHGIVDPAIYSRNNETILLSSVTYSATALASLNR